MNSITDSDTEALILELQLQDVDRLIKGKQREGDASDAELAAELYKAELEIMFCLVSDRAMSRSLARAVVLDGDIIAAHADVEQQAEQDREQALTWDTLGQTERQRQPPETIDDEMINKLVCLYMEDVHSKAGESSSQAAKRTGSANRQCRCEACHADFPFFDVLRCPCSHEYCRGCIAELFRASLSDESLFPPRCCRQPIPLGLNQVFLSPKLVGEYRAKSLEYETPNRTYCHVATCSTFVPPPFIHDGVATCVRC